MAINSETNQDCYRVIVLRDSGAELLVVPTERGFELPSLEVPRLQRVAVNLTAALREQWGCEAICLFDPKVSKWDSRAKPFFWQVMEYRRDAETASTRAVWTRVSAASADCFVNSKDFSSLRHSLEQFLGREPDNTQPFLRMGWFEELQDWVQQVIRPLGADLTGRSSQLNASPSFSLIRFETTGPAVWFKAVGQPNQHEFAITTTLSRFAAQHLPAIVATRPAWHGWLMKDGGPPMTKITPTVDTWRQVADDLAGLQIESIPHLQELLTAGARDLQTPRLVALVDPFLHSMETLMRQQINPSPAPLSPKDLLELRVALKDTIAALDQIGLPATLGHSDFNPGNVLWTGNGSVFIDWAEAHVGHPFFTFEYLLSHLRRACPDVAQFEDLIKTAYAQPWKYVAPAQAIAEAVVFSPLVSVFAYATSLNEWSEACNPQAQAYLRSLTRRMKREADQLKARRMVCRPF
jgi:hypothetical protein